MPRIVFAFVFFCVLGSCAAVQHAYAASPAGVQERAVAQATASLASLTESMTRQQAELEAAIAEATARADWSNQERARFLQTILGSPTNLAFERHIASLTQELRGMLQALQRGDIKGEPANSRYVTEVGERVARLGAVHRRQSAYLTGQLGQVRAKGCSPIGRAG